jgi:hypothetical protein
MVSITVSLLCQETASDGLNMVYKLTAFLVRFGFGLRHLALELRENIMITFFILAIQNAGH